MYNFRKDLSFDRCLTVFCYGLAIFIALYSWSPLLNAKWGLFDDHEIISFVGMDERLQPSRFIDTLEGTELNPNSTQTRFRPSYYALRAIEAMVWGKDPSLWYGFRIAVAVVFSLSLAYVSLSFAGPILSIGFLIFVLSAPYWADIFARAGPAELYAVLGASLIFFSIGGLKHKTSANLLQVCGLVCGLIIAAGSKENFLFLIFIPLFLLYSRQVKVRSMSGLLLIFSILFIIWIGLTIYFRLKSASGLIYGLNENAAHIGILSVLKLVGSFLLRPVVVLWISIVLVTWYFGRVAERLNRFALSLTHLSIDVNSRVFIIVQLGLLTIYASQYLFYSGTWPYVSALGRYSFPGVLARDWAILSIVIAILGLGQMQGFSRQFVMKLQATVSVALICLTVAPFILFPNYVANRKTALSTTADTSSFSRKYLALVDFLSNNPNVSIIINSHSFSDYEPIFSIATFLQFSSIKNKIAVNAEGLSLKNFAEHSNELGLASAIHNLASHGDDQRFVPLGTVDQSSCISLGMSGPYLKSCKFGGVSVWPY